MLALLGPPSPLRIDPHPTHSHPRASLNHGLGIKIEEILLVISG